MKAILHGRGYANELTGTVDDRGNLALDEPILISANSRVRVIILCSEEAIEVEPDDTPLEEVSLSLRRALQNRHNKTQEN
jgi:hypothetical protein